MSENGSAFSFEGDVGTVVAPLERPDVIGSNAESAGDAELVLIAERAGESMVFCVLMAIVGSGREWQETCCVS